MMEANAMSAPLPPCPVPALHDSTNKLEISRPEGGAKAGETPQAVIDLEVVSARLEERLQNRQSSPGESCWMDKDTPLSTLPSSPCLSSIDATNQVVTMQPQDETVTTAPKQSSSSHTVKRDAASRKRANDTPPTPRKPQKTPYAPRRSLRKPVDTSSATPQSQNKYPRQPQQKPKQSAPCSPPMQENRRLKLDEPTAVPSPCDSDTQRLKGRKEFLVAGLYSPFFKQSSNKAVPRPSRKKRLTGPFVLPLPIHQGATFLENQTEFQVPRDIMQDHLLGYIRPPLEQPRFTRIKSSKHSTPLYVSFLLIRYRYIC